MIDNMMKISLTLVAIDKMSRVIKDAVKKSETEFQKLQNEIKETSRMFDEMGKKIATAGAGLTAAGVGIAHQLGMTDAIQEAFEFVLDEKRERLPIELASENAIDNATIYAALFNSIMTNLICHNSNNH